MFAAMQELGSFIPYILYGKTSPTRSFPEILKRDPYLPRNPQTQPFGPKSDYFTKQNITFVLNPAIFHLKFEILVVLERFEKEIRPTISDLNPTCFCLKIPPKFTKFYLKKFNKKTSFESKSKLLKLLRGC